MSKKIEKENALASDFDVDYVESANVVNDVSQIIEQSQQKAYWAVDVLLLRRNWLIGKRLYNEELRKARKDNYGLKIIRQISKDLTFKYGKGFNAINLYYFYRFYKEYRDIFYTVSKESFLSWTHYRVLLGVEDINARKWYEKETLENRWSVRALQRNIETQYYYRLMSSPNKEAVKKEMEERTKDNEILKTLEHIKNPSILEFLSLSKNDELYESTIETAIINNLQKIPY